MGWLKSWAEWVEGDTAYISVPFTWLLQEANMRASAYAQEGKRVRMGGPAVSLCPDRLHPFVEVGGQVNALQYHNPNATFTSRGCIRQCGFCGVPKTEGCLVELEAWERKPIVCDNNLLACSRKHFDRVIDILKGIRGVDFNQGLDARLLTAHHASRIAELNMEIVRLSWDHINDESAVMDAIATLRQAGFSRRMIGCYVLIGYDDNPADAFYRLQKLKDMGMRPNAMRYQSLTSYEKNDYLGNDWTVEEMARFMHYWNRLRYLEHVPFEEYVHAK